jgi:hypothetical protein
MSKVISLSRRTKKGRTAAESRAVERDKKITDVVHLQNRIKSLCQVIYALILERDDPDAVVIYQRDDLVTLNPDDVTIVVHEHAKTNHTDRPDADVMIRIAPRDPDTGDRAPLDTAPAPNAG